MAYKEKNFYNENNTYKKIMTCPHEKLMHFCTNLEDFKNINNHYLKVCTTVRTKHKFLTFIINQSDIIFFNLYYGKIFNNYK